MISTATAASSAPAPTLSLWLERQGTLKVFVFHAYVFGESFTVCYFSNSYIQVTKYRNTEKKEYCMYTSLCGVSFILGSHDSQSIVKECLSHITNTAACLSLCLLALHSSSGVALFPPI